MLKVVPKLYACNYTDHGRLVWLYNTIQIKYINCNYINLGIAGEKLAARLRELEAEKSRLEWEREEEACRRKAEEAVRAEHQSRIQARERELCKQEVSMIISALMTFDYGGNYCVLTEMVTGGVTSFFSSRHKRCSYIHQV